MSLKYIILYLLVGAAILTSCAPNVEPPLNMDYNYIPVDTGRYYIYDVDSIYIDYTTTPTPTNDTTHYQIKEFYPYTFLDGLNEEVFSCTRYYRMDTTQSWTLMTANVWWLKRTTTRLEKHEENITFVKMTYPVDVNYTWDGNAYNILGPQTYSYGPMDVPFYDGTTMFDSTITVNQLVDTNLIEYYMHTETYDRNIGMVHKTIFDIPNLALDTTYINPWPYTGLDWFQVPKLARVKIGTLVSYKLIEYGFE